MVKENEPKEMLLRRCFYKMKAMLILVGTELLNGGMVDTNSIYMAEELNKYGIEQKKCY